MNKLLLLSWAWLAVAVWGLATGEDTTFIAGIVCSTVNASAHTVRQAVQSER